MHYFYIHSNDVRFVHPVTGDSIDHVAVFDEAQLSEFVLSLRIVGRDEKKLERIKKAIYQFLNYWDEGERHIFIRLLSFTITVSPTEVARYKSGMFELGTRPVNPEREVLAAMNRLQQSINHKSPNAAALYQELQDTIKKYPTLQIKDKA